MKKYKLDIIMIIVTIILSILIVLVSKSIFKGNFINDKLSKNVNYHKATIVSIEDEFLEEDPYIDNLELGTQNVTVKIEDGDLKDVEYSIVNKISRLYNIKVKEGSKVIVGIYKDNGNIVDIAIYSYDRSLTLIGLIVLFILVVIAVGGIKGIKAIISLLFTLISVIYLMIPLMLKGVSPIIATIIIAILSVTITLVLVSGKSKKTIAAILGTIAGVIIAGIIAVLFGNMAHLSGITMEDAESIMYIAEDTGLKVTGIMFTGILVASLGAVMDVAMSIASSIFEINSLNSKLHSKDLFISGMNIGRDIIGTMANTLILAFAGGSITTLLMIYSSSMTTRQLINLDVVGTEVIQGIAGSIGIVLTVPITAVIAVCLCKYSSKKQNNR